MSEEEFDEESFQAYEDELYGEKSDSEDKIESDVEETLYGQVHYSFSLPEDDQPEEQDEDGEDGANDMESRPSPIVINIVEESSVSPAVITISDDDANDCSKNDDDDHNGVSQPSPETQEKWDLIDKDLEDDTLGGSKRGRSRYYLGAKQYSQIRCHNCNEKGHMARDCPEPKKIITCILCGIPGHMRRDCPNELCFNCSEPGHRSFRCPQVRVRWFDQCHRCFQTGHHSNVCPDLWRQYHFTTVAGIAPVPDRTNEFQGPVYCYNCGEQGHYGYECPNERPRDHTTCYFKFIVKYDGENRSLVVNERIDNRKRKHERETDSPANHKHSKKVEQQNKQQQKRRDHQDSGHRKSWPRQNEQGSINEELTPIRSKGKNKKRQKSWPIQNEPGNEDLITMTSKGSKKKQKAKRKSHEPPKSAAPKARKLDDKREDKNAIKDINKELVVCLDEHHSERSVKLRPKEVYHDHDQPQDDTVRRTVELSDPRDSRLSDSLKQVMDDWGELHERGNRKSLPNRQNRNLSPGYSRNDSHSSPGFWRDDDRSPSDNRLSPVFMHEEDPTQPDPRDLYSSQDFKRRPRNRNNQTPYQSNREKKIPSSQNSSNNDNRSFIRSDNDYPNSLPGPDNRGRYSSSGPAHQNRDYFPGSANQKWPKKNKARNSKRGFRSKKNKNFTL